MEKTSENQEKYSRHQAMETCVLCGKATDITRETPVDERFGYIEGAGQLCRECFKQLNNL